MGFTIISGLELIKGSESKEVVEEVSSEWTEWLGSIGVLDIGKGDWVVCKGVEDRPCYKRVELKVCNRVSLKDFKDKEDIIAEKLGVDKVRVENEKSNIVVKIVKIDIPDVRFRNEKVSRNEISIGVDIDNELVKWNWLKDSHCLIAGVPGCGKSTLIYQIIIQCLSRGVGLYIADLKLGVDLVDFMECKGVKRFVDNVEGAKSMINEFKEEADRRFRLLREAHCNNFVNYIEKNGENSLNEIVMIIDEYADLAVDDGVVKKKRGKDKENEYIPSTLDKLVELARKCRAVGMHIVLSTQRPSVSVIPGVLKSNFSCVIGFRTMNKSNSEVIIDEEGLERLANRECKSLIEGRLYEFRTLYLNDREKNGYIKELM